MNMKEFHVRIPNSKGLFLSASLYVPVGRSQKYPYVHVLHGFTGYKEGADLVDLSRRLAEEGIVSVRFTASGFGDSDGTIEHDYRLTNHLSDLEAVDQYVKALPYVDASHSGVCGHSMGGKLALLFAATHPSISAICVISAPVSFMGTAYEPMMQSWKQTGYFKKVSGRDGKSIRVPYAYVIDADTLPVTDVLIAAQAVTQPTLVIAGESDIEVPWTETKKIFDCVSAKQKEWVCVPGMGHKYAKTPELFPVVHGKIVSFISSKVIPVC